MQQSSLVGITGAVAAGTEIQEELARCDLQLSWLFRIRRLHENFRLLRDVAGRQGWREGQRADYCGKLEKVGFGIGAVRCGSIQLEVHPYLCTSVSFG